MKAGLKIQDTATWELTRTAGWDEVFLNERRGTKDGVGGIDKRKGTSNIPRQHGRNAG